MLILIRGLPGSGKSTIANSVKAAYDKEGDLESIVVEADDYFIDGDGNYCFNREKIGEAHEYCQQIAYDALYAKKEVIVANTFSTEKELQPYFDMARELGVPYIVIKCTGNYGSVHNVPATTVDNMRNRWENISYEYTLAG